MESNESPNTFTPFSRLPTEIRLKIWNFIIPGPRTVSIQYKMRPTKRRGNAMPYSCWTSTEPNPIALQICRESRDEALKFYEPAFGSHASERKIYFDFERDILSFARRPGDSLGPMDYRLDIFLAGDYLGGEHDAEKRVREMVIDVRQDIYDRRMFIWHDVRLFTRLEELTILAWSEEEAVDVLDLGESTLKEVARKHADWVVPKVWVRDPVHDKIWGKFGGFGDSG